MTEEITLLTITRKGYKPMVRPYTSFDALVNYLDYQLDDNDVKELLDTGYIEVDCYGAEFFIATQHINPSKFD